MRKEIKERNKRECDSELYNTLLGSYITTLRILKKLDITNQMANNVYKKYKRKALAHKLSDTTWMEDIAKDLGVDIPYGMMAYCVGKFNMLITPAAIEGDNVIIFPLSPDGMLSRTLLDAQHSGKVFMIEEETTCGTDDEI